jgi:hypothetical protein
MALLPLEEKQRTMPMTTDQIEINRCYRLRAMSGRQIIARVVSFGERQERFTESEDANRPGGASFTISHKVARFVWRDTRDGTQWSASQQQLTLADFAFAADDEVLCD